MVTYRGFRTYVQYDEETAFGTGATAATAIAGRIQNVTINKSNNLIRAAGLGEGRNETFTGWGNFEGTWSMEYLPADFAFLQFLIGSMHGSGTTAAPYYLQEKDFTDYTAGATYGLKSFGLEVGSEDTSGTDDVDTLVGCVIESAGLSLEVGNALRCALEGFYQKPVTTASATAFTASTARPWIFAQGAFKWNGTAIGRVTSATINIKNNYDYDMGRELGSRFPVAAEPGLRKYDWTITVKMTSTIASTLIAHFYGASGSPSTGVASSEPTFYDIILDLSEGATTGLRNAQILLEYGSINDISKPINIGDNIVELTINGCAKRGKVATDPKPFKWWTTT